MSGRIIVLLLILLLSSHFCPAVELSTPGPVGTAMSINDYGVIEDWWVGNNPNTRVFWMTDGCFIVSVNGEPPLQVNDPNVTFWDGINPPAPVGGAFFHPGIYEDFSHDALSPNVWSTVVKYEEPANNVLLMGGLGYHMYDPSPHFGLPYVEFMSYIQLTNLSPQDVTVNPFVYFRSYGDMNWTYYSNHGLGFYQNIFKDYDWVDGTSDDFVVLQHGNPPWYAYAFWMPGYPPTHYRIQLSDDLLNDILNGGQNYNLPNSTVAVGMGGSETAWQYGPFTLAPDQALLFYIYPKAMKVDVNTLTNIDYDRINVAPNAIAQPIVFEDTDVTIDFDNLTLVNPLVNTYTQIIAAELTGGMVESPLAGNLQNVSTVRYWEIFSDTRCQSFMGDITFSYDPVTDGIQDENDLLIAYRSDYDQPWVEFPMIQIDEVNNTITAVDAEEFGQYALASTGNNNFQPEVGEVFFLTYMTLPASPPFFPNPVDTMDISAGIPEGGSWTMQPMNLAGLPWQNLQPAADGLAEMNIQVPPGFVQGYEYAKVWVELNINQNTQYTPGFPWGFHVWLNNMYFEPMAGFPDNALWINADFYGYLYDAAGDSFEYGIDLNPFNAPLYVTFVPGNMEPFVATLSGYNPNNGTFFNFQTSGGALSAQGIIPDAAVNWAYNIWHFTPFIGGLNNGEQTQTTIAWFNAEAGDEAVLLTWVTQTEFNSDYFNVYRDGEVIATVPAAGLSPDPLAYNYYDEGLTPGQEYAYEVSVVMTDGSEWVYPDALNMTPTSSELENIQLTIQIEGNDVVLNWTEAVETVVYAVHRSTDPYFVPSMETEIIRTMDTTYTDVDAVSTESSLFYKIVPVLID
ncbi:hypothetical protein ISS30_02465 [bacterium]|nr:hypothetical protein [FCB group bacterium]MBL7190532.1 hypothetical protein [bacterium]